MLEEISYLLVFKSKSNAFLNLIYQCDSVFDWEYYSDFEFNSVMDKHFYMYNNYLFIQCGESIMVLDKDDLRVIKYALLKGIEEFNSITGIEVIDDYLVVLEANSFKVIRKYYYGKDLEFVKVIEINN